MPTAQFVKSTAEGALLVITLDRPRANALNASMVEEIHGAVGDAEPDAVRAS